MKQSKKMTETYTKSTMPNLRGNGCFYLNFAPICLRVKIKKLY